MFWRAVKEQNLAHQGLSAAKASPASPREWKASELSAAHRSHSLGLPDKHFRNSFQKNNLDIHYLRQPSRAHSPAFPWCFQRGLGPSGSAAKPRYGIGKGGNNGAGRGAACGCRGLALRQGHTRSGSSLFFCSELCLSALWRSKLSSGSSTQTRWLYLFYRK